MRKNRTLKITFTALFASLICVTTMLLPIPLPGAGGYANPGDGFILIGAFLLSPMDAAIAAGLGSALADLLSGYAVFAPASLVIKGLAALIAAWLVRHKLHRVLSGLLAEIAMTVGYFLYESMILRCGMGAIASVPGNLGQAVVGVAIASLLTPMLEKSPEITHFVHLLQ